MRTYDHTLRIETINAILRGLSKSPDIDKPGSRDNIRALALLDEKRRRDKRRFQGSVTLSTSIKHYGYPKS